MKVSFVTNKQFIYPEEKVFFRFLLTFEIVCVKTATRRDICDQFHLVVNIKTATNFIWFTELEEIFARQRECFLFMNIYFL